VEEVEAEYIYEQKRPIVQFINDNLFLYICNSDYASNSSTQYCWICLATVAFKNALWCRIIKWVIMHRKLPLVHC